MNDNEIIKALECCLGENAMCELCPYDKHLYRSCMDNLLGDVIDLINRLQAENERLQKAIKVQDIMIEQQDYKIKSTKSEAIKEFAERLKEEWKPDPNYEKAVNFTIKLFRNTIDSLAKEMVGDNNG